MSQRRGILTDQLDNVLQVIQLGKRTGHLTIERGEAPRLEIGEIVFSSGQVVGARCGQLQGQTAWNWLSTWTTCRYVFTTTNTDRTTGPINKVQQLKITPPQRLRDTNPSLSSFSTPNTGFDQASQTGPLFADTQPQAALALYPQRISSGDEGLQRIGQAQLSRHHRHLFLLIDGSRTVLELIRLTGKRPDEVQQLLLDLKHIGIIYY